MGSVFRPRVAIIGAGLTGLLTAQGLVKNGFDVVVFEREAHIQARTRDWTLVVHWAMPIMRDLMPEALFDQLSEAVTNPYLSFDDTTDSLRLYDGLTGEIMFTSVLPGARRYSRQRLRRLMATGIDIRWGRRLQAIEPTHPSGDGPVVLRFEEGEPATVDYVLGADGSGSRVRELVMKSSGDATAAAAKRSGIMFATGIVRYNDADRVRSVTDAHPVFSMAMGGGVVGGSGIMYVDKAPDDPASWTVFWNKLWKRSRVGDTEDDPTKPSPFAGLQGRPALDYITQHTPPLCQPFQKHVEWTVEVDDANRARAKAAAEKADGNGNGNAIDNAKTNTHPDVVCYIDDMKYWVPVPFDNFGGHVTLAGDAAHPMLIYRGQGFQHAIVDSRNYVDALIRVREAGGTAEAHRREMDQYDAEMVPRGAEAVKQSLQEGENSFDIDKVRNMRMAKQGHVRSA